MAIQLNTRYTGRIEDLIYYERLGDYLIRTMGQQTMATQRAAKDFGRASSLAKNLRRVLSPIIPDPRDRKMQNSLTVAVRHFLASTKKHTSTDLQNNPLAGFLFGANSSLAQCLLFPLSITEVGEGRVSIGFPQINPVEAIVAPAGTTRLEIRLTTATAHPDNDLKFSDDTAVLEIPYISGLHAPQSIDLETGSEPGSVIVVVATLRYWNGSEPIRQAAFMPVEIVAAGIRLS
ncbi:hypothetical protein GZH53_09980 [Flavihumibacter sp. R14]|nr:hypothetical protein [Flavihumibacter soli]